MPPHPWIAAAVLLSAAQTRADVEVAPLIGEGMVFQRGRPMVVWGRAQPGERVDVSMAQRGTTVVADGEGRWEVQLHPMVAGGPHTLYVAGDNALRFDDVMVGDVWVCSGQSDMELPLGEVEGGPEESRGADGSDLRLFRVAPADADEPFEGVRGTWQRAAPVAARAFSAVGWYFGRRLEYELDVPVGLIQCTGSGSFAEPWVELARLEADESLQPSLERALGSEHARPGALYNGMVHPLSRFPVRGVVWYQGESNVPVAQCYAGLFRTLIECWREAWDDPELFFLFVQLPNHGESDELPRGDSPWAMLREAQTRALDLPHTAMVVTIDLDIDLDLDLGIGIDDDTFFDDDEDLGLYPTDKRPYGRRLAGVALTDVYGRGDVESRGPTPAETRIDGAEVRVRFQRVGEGLSTVDGEAPRGFALSGEDRSWSWARARIEGGDTVVLECDEVLEPVAVRYAWSDEPLVNLVGAASLPAEPFRSDDWPYGEQTGR